MIFKCVGWDWQELRDYSESERGAWRYIQLLWFLMEAVSLARRYLNGCQSFNYIDEETDGTRWPK